MTGAQRTYLKWALTIAAVLFMVITTDLRGSSGDDDISRLLTFSTYKDSYPLPGYPCQPDRCVTWHYGWHLRRAHYRYGFWYGAVLPLVLIGIAGFLQVGQGFNRKPSQDGDSSAPSSATIPWGQAMERAAKILGVALLSGAAGSVVGAMLLPRPWGFLVGFYGVSVVAGYIFARFTREPRKAK